MKIISMKYDGSLRDESTPGYFSMTADAISVFSRSGHPFFHHKSGEWRENENGLVELFFTNRYYNVMHIFEHVNHRNAMYINLCLPARIEENKLIWVDMDLDLRVDLDGNVERLDEEEFEINCIRFGYPEILEKRIRKEAEALPEAIHDGQFPFNYNEQASRYAAWKANKSLFL